MLLQGKVIVVTGATKGIGRAIALSAAREGAHVILGGRDQNAAEKLIAEIDSFGTGDAVFCAGDLNSVACCE